MISRRQHCLSRLLLHFMQRLVLYACRLSHISASKAPHHMLHLSARQDGNAYAACAPTKHADGRLPSAHMLQPAVFNALLVTCRSCTPLINHSTQVQPGCHTLTHTVPVLLTGRIASGAEEPAAQLALHVYAPWMSLPWPLHSQL